MLTRNKTFLMLFALATVLVSAALLSAPQIAVGQGGDFRLNCDEAAPVVLFCGADSLDIYRVGADGVSLALRVPYENFDMSRPVTYTEVASTPDGKIGVYVLRTWELQVNAINGNELWTARWWGCPGDPAQVEVFSLLTGERLSRERDTCSLPGAGWGEVPYCEYTNPYDGSTGTTACNQLCEYGEGQLWWCDDICDVEGVPTPCGELN